MHSTWLVLLALALGLVLGVGFALLFGYAARHGKRVASVAAPRVPEGVEQVLDALESAGLVVDPSGNVVKASRMAYLTGLVREGVLVHSELDDLATVVRDTGASVKREFRQSAENFGEVDRELVARGARLGSRYILIMVSDVTEDRRLDDVRRDFIANISHELKTPIGAIMLLAESLQPASDDPERVRRFGGKIEEEAQRLARITGDIIELSRLQANETVADPALVDLDEVITAALDRNRTIAESKSVELIAKVHGKPAVIGDRNLLIVAVDNLISNAVNYSPEGTRVGIGASESKGIISVTVTDQGEGIADAEQSRIFERFFRADPARSRHTGGTGLGLSIVKHTVSNHGGDVSVWSKLGAGSTFTIRLPAAADDAQSTLSAPR